MFKNFGRFLVKSLSIIVITVLLTVLPSVSKTYAATIEGQPLCQDITITRTNIFGRTSSDNIASLLPTDNTVTISFNNPGNLNSTYILDTFGMSGNITGVVGYKRNYNTKPDLLTSTTKTSGKIQFDFISTRTENNQRNTNSKSYIIGGGVGLTNYPLIPLHPDFIDNAISFGVIEGTNYTTNRINGLRCKFILTPTNQCSADPSFQFIQNTDGNQEKLTMSFNRNSALLPGSLENNFKSSIESNQTTEISINPISSTNDPNRVLFEIIKNDNTTSQYFEGNVSQTLNLKYNDKLICQHTYNPSNQLVVQQLEHCKITPLYDIQSVDGKQVKVFNNTLRIDYPPRYFFDKYDGEIKEFEDNMIDFNDTLGVFIVPKINYPNLYNLTQPIQGLTTIRTLNDYPCAYGNTSDYNSCAYIYKQQLDNAYSNEEFIDPNTGLVFPKTPSLDIKVDNVFSKGEYIANIFFDLYAQSRIRQLYKCGADFTIGDLGAVEENEYTPPTEDQSFDWDILQLCDVIKDKDQGLNFEPGNPKTEYQKCYQCLTSGQNKIWTALGCVSTDSNGLIKSFFSVGLGLAGGIALLFFIYGGFLVLTSQGNAEQVQHGREIITSAIAGLLLIIFSVFILRFFAVDILQLPWFDKQEAQQEENNDNEPPTPTICQAGTVACGSVCCNSSTQECQNIPGNDIPICVAKPTPTPIGIPTPTPTPVPTSTPIPTPTPTPQLPQSNFGALRIDFVNLTTAAGLPQLDSLQDYIVSLTGSLSNNWKTLVIVTNGPETSQNRIITDCQNNFVAKSENVVEGNIITWRNDSTSPQEGAIYPIFTYVQYNCSDFLNKKFSEIQNVIATTQGRLLFTVKPFEE